MPPTLVPTRLARACRAALLTIGAGACACATVPREQAGQMIIAVDSTVQLHLVRFDSTGGTPFTMGDFAAHRYVIRYLLPPGRYCLHSVVTSLTDGERQFTFDDECVDLQTGAQVYFGHLRYEGDEVVRVVDRARLDGDLADASVPKYADRVGVAP